MRKPRLRTCSESQMMPTCDCAVRALNTMSFFLELRPLSFGQISGSRSTATNSQLLRATQSFSTANGKKEIGGVL